ncbi:DUF4198 domain-containing protein [Vibrio ordalii]|nr:DUF4198 domain-containing protein [Vibrio ordalii]
MSYRFICKSLLIASAFVSASLQAHPRWLLPSEFTISAKEGDWVTTDATASHGTFVFDKPLSVDSGYVLTPSGKRERFAFSAKHKRKSTFDFFFYEQGTHKIALVGTPFYMTNYTVGARNTARRIAANSVERQALLPEGAQNVKTVLMFNRTEAYITVNEPSAQVFALENQLLELVPVTHPADMVEGEEIVLQFFFNGQAQAGVEAEIRQDGTLYRNQQQALIIHSDNEGKIRFTPEQAGRYLLIAGFSGALSDNALADEARSSIHLTFEVVLK